MNHHPQGAGRSPRPLLPYGISTFTLKNRWAAFVGHTHAASIRFVLPRMVYTRTSPLELRLGDHVTIGISFDIVIMAWQISARVEFTTVVVPFSNGAAVTRDA